MPDQVNGGQGQEPAANATGQGQAPADGTQGQEPGTQFDLSQIQDPAVRAWAEAMERSAREARQEAARYRTERNQGRQQFDQFRQERETEAERIQREAQEARQELEQLKAQNRDLTVGVKARDAATKAGAFNPELVYQTVKAHLDDDGSNLPELIKDLRKSDPYLFRRTDADAGAGQGQGSRPGRDMNDIIRRAAGRVSAD